MSLGHPKTKDSLSLVTQCDLHPFLENVIVDLTQTYQQLTFSRHSKTLYFMLAECVLLWLIGILGFLLR